MPAINNLNVQVDQNLNNLSNQGIQVQQQQQAAQQAQGLSPSQLLQLIKTGSIVEGRVLSQNPDGTYNVKLENNFNNIPELKANATLPLIVGERFRAVWDASGSGEGEKVPVLRLSQGELSFLSQVSAKDRELATALLSRGLPLSSEIMTEIRDAWRKAGFFENSNNNNLLSSMIELWARGVPITAENAALLAEYAALDAEAATFLWDKIRKEIKERASKGQDPISALKNMKSGNDDTARFLNAHSILMRSPRDDINPALLSAPFWPVAEDAEMTARVFVGRSVKEDEDKIEGAGAGSGAGKRYWQIGFNLKGYELGNVGGIVESDGRGCNVNLQAENSETCGVLTARRREIRRELDGIDFPVRFIGISRRAVASETIRAELMRARGLDVKV